MKSPDRYRYSLPALSAAAGGLLAVAVIALCPGVLGLEPRVSHAVETAPEPGLAWNDLADADTSTYAANLRAIGCPEETIRRIVTRGESATNKVAAPAPPIAARTAAPAPPPIISAQPVGTIQPAFAPVPQDVVIVAPEGRVPLPVAFQPLPQDVKMTTAQQAQLNMIQEEFIAAIGGANQSPASPEYKEKWRQAQRKSDEQFKITFGQVAFLRRHMATIRAEQAPVPGS